MVLASVRTVPQRYLYVFEHLFSAKEMYKTTWWTKQFSSHILFISDIYSKSVYFLQNEFHYFLHIKIHWFCEEALINYFFSRSSFSMSSKRAHWLTAVFKNNSIGKGLTYFQSYSWAVIEHEWLHAHIKFQYQEK